MNHAKQINWYIPTADNNRISIAAADRSELEASVIELFGPLTIYPSLRGIWFNRAGVRFDDPIMLIQVVVEDRPDLAGRISDLATLVLDRFGQLELFVTLGDVGVLSFGCQQPNSPENGRGDRTGGVPPIHTDTLTPREWEVVAELLKGKTNQEIARALWISEHTVGNHLRHIYRKVGVSSRTQLILALSNGRRSRKNSGNLS
jgi:DNA-binding CsgD family transcriptional regulator